ncbi:hypothetical protein [Actinophytocola sp. KF-1]
MTKVARSAPTSSTCAGTAHIARRVDAGGVGAHTDPRLSYRDGSGHLDDGTSILGEDGELSPDQVSAC